MYSQNSDVRVPALLAEQRSFVATVLGNEFVASILELLRGTDLPKWYLSGGCLFQTVWNAAHGFERSAGILDYDLFYFDSSDLSAHSEQVVGEELARTFAHLPVEIEVRNQARVHLWYETEFGAPCRAFERCEDGIDGFLATCCCFGIRHAHNEQFDVYAPHGFDDLFGMVVRPNPARTIDSGMLSHVYQSKVQRWSRVWPRLKIVQWPSDPSRSAQHL
jgi:hypothetical protein